MNILVKGYKNLRDFEYNLETNKLNVIIGISGSGKSSIAEAMTNTNLEINKTVNFTSEIIAKLDDTIDKKISLFSDKTVERYLFDDSRTDNVYNVFVDEDGQVEVARDALEKRLFNIETAIKNYEQYEIDLLNLQKNLGATLNTKGGLKDSCAILKTKKSLEKLKSKTFYKKIETLGEKKSKWMIDGVDLITNNQCPFCDKNLNKTKIKEVDNFRNFEITSHKKLKESENMLPMLGMDLTKDLINVSQLESLEKKMIQIGKALKSFLKFKNDIDKLYRSDLDYTKLKFDYASDVDLLVVFPLLKQHIIKLSRDLEKLKNNVKKSIEKTKIILKRRINFINDTLESFGIPYMIEAEHKKNIITNYKLYHREDSEKINRNFGLSNGEKKIIALVFFILENIKQNNDLIVFDDPVSSYDENRRLSIFNFIYEQLKGKTILILSHDEVFAKFSAGKNGRYIGNIDYFENHDNITLTNITSSDFKDINYFIYEAIKYSENYMQKIINLRYFYELNKKGIIYSYLSSILHKKYKPSFFDNKNTTEALVISEINKKFDIELELFDESYYLNINTSNYSLIEKMYLLREINVDKKIRDELSNHIHLNSKYAISLSPYKYSFCSKYVYDSIILNIPDLISI